MAVRQMVYPVYKAEVFEGGDIRLRFTTPGSKLGPVYVVLARNDAEILLESIDKACLASEEADS
jgi:hypothetical protein